MNNLSIGDYCVIIYFIVGIILAIYWWHTEHKKNYEECRATGECEESMVIMLWLFTILLWPVITCAKLSKKYDKRRQDKFGEFQEGDRDKEIDSGRT